MDSKFQEAIKRLMLRSEITYGQLSTPLQEAPLPSVPTWHLCGSREKIEILRQRVERGEELFHPEDSTAEVAPGYESGFKAERQSESVLEPGR